MRRSFILLTALAAACIALMPFSGAKTAWAAFPFITEKVLICAGAVQL
jgi:hypothetical protein